MVQVVDCECSSSERIIDRFDETIRQEIRAERLKLHSCDRSSQVLIIHHVLDLGDDLRVCRQDFLHACRLFHEFGESSPVRDHGLQLDVLRLCKLAEPDDHVVSAASPILPSSLSYPTPFIVTVGVRSTNPRSLLFTIWYWTTEGDPFLVAAPILVVECWTELVRRVRAMSLKDIHRLVVEGSKDCVIESDGRVRVHELQDCEAGQLCGLQNGPSLSLTEVRRDGDDDVTDHLLTASARCCSSFCKDFGLLQDHGQQFLPE